MTNSDVIRKIKTIDVWYHAIDLGDGVVTPGMYDMRPHVAEYRFPKSLAGQRVLDVGASNGFFAFLFESLGAREVVATNLARYQDHDYPKWFLERELARYSQSELQRIDSQQSVGGFEVAREILKSRVVHKLTTVYRLRDSVEGVFDFAFCGSLLVHLRDPVLALESIREVVRPGGRVIVATSMDATAPEQSYAIFNGKPEQVSWWVMSRECLVRMCRMAGFDDIRWTGSFLAKSVHGFVDQIGIVSMIRP